LCLVQEEATWTASGTERKTFQKEDVPERRRSRKKTFQKEDVPARKIGIWR
jgi:hypothetical protein